MVTGLAKIITNISPLTPDIVNAIVNAFVFLVEKEITSLGLDILRTLKTLINKEGDKVHPRKTLFFLTRFSWKTRKTS